MGSICQVSGAEGEKCRRECGRGEKITGKFFVLGTGEVNSLKEIKKNRKGSGNIRQHGGEVAPEKRRRPKGQGENRLPIN